MSSQSLARSAGNGDRRSPVRVRTLLVLVVVASVLGLRAYRRRTLRRHADEFYATYGRP
jgi:hypothetical protein